MSVKKKAIIEIRRGLSGTTIFVNGETVCSTTTAAQIQFMCSAIRRELRHQGHAVNTIWTTTRQYQTLQGGKHVL